LNNSFPFILVIRQRRARGCRVLFENIARSIGEAPRQIQLRHVGHCLKADPAYGKGIADALGIPMSEVPA